MSQLLHRKLNEKIIGIYYNVYNRLSHTYPEYILGLTQTELVEAGFGRLNLRNSPF